MTKRKRTDFQREADLPRIAEMYKDGKLQVQIAQTFGLSQGQISHDIAEIRRRWRAESTEAFSDKANAELEKIDSLEIIAWQEWDKSLADAVSMTVETKTVTLKQADEDGNIIELPAIETKTTRRVTKQTGNTAYTDTIKWCIDRRCKLLGLDAPTKQEVSGANGSPLLVKIEYVDVDIDPVKTSHEHDLYVPTEMSIA